MEFFLLPNHCGVPPISVPKTPYVSHQRYDGGPFLSYPVRVGKAGAGSASLDLMSYQRAERVNPTPLRDNEAFVQTWLYFGFISEFLCANAKESSAESSVHMDNQEIIDQIYDMLLVPESDSFNIELNEEKLNKLLEIARPRLPTERVDRIKHYDHLFNCLAHAHPIFSSLPKTFNHSVKYSISGLCELVAQATRALLSLMGVERVFGRGWASGYLNEEARDSMIGNGWCPSDITRAEAKFQSLQAMHIVTMLDRSLPKRDHSQCTDMACSTYQIDIGKYQVGHEQANCTCKELVVHPQELEDILHKDERVPLLRLTGELHDLKAELVESDINTPYIAISHVWADGLGNPFANSLHRCKLARLRELVSAMDISDPPNAESPLIWLDTLCCPAKDGEGKQKAIEKIRLVYQRAKHVLVLDAGLMAYASKDQEIHEIVVRIFTSGWVRRLWTLQEGALARSLYFQFADEAVSLLGLRQSFGLHANSVRHQIFALDSMQEFWRIDAFFKSDQHTVSGENPNLVVLDQALQFRSVSVPSDEPLCIGTLMSLDLFAILDVDRKDDRMRKVWELLAAKMGGIPALVIFMEEQRIDTKGWRWCPRTLLSYDKSIHVASVRSVRWSHPQRGSPTPLGLKVRFPGFKITVNKYKDGKPRKPWPGFKRIPEAYLHVRDSNTEEWYMLSDKKYAWLSLNWTTDEERREHNKLELFPLHDVADTDKALVLMRKQLEHTTPEEAIFAFPNVNEEDAIEKDLRGKEEDGIALKTERHIMIYRLSPDEGYLYETVRKLAMQVRADDLTDKHLELYAQLQAEAKDSLEVVNTNMQENEEFKASVEALRKKMKVITAEVVSQDQRFLEATETYFGRSFLEDIWVLIQDFFNHDFLATKLADDQIWYVD